MSANDNKNVYIEDYSVEELEEIVKKYNIQIGNGFVSIDYVIK